jgi:hypothetical protein
MDTELTVAMVSALVTVAVAGFTIWANQRQSARNAVHEAKTQRDLAAFNAQLERQGKDAARAVEARVILDRYRKPLLVSAVELRSRIGNIRSNAFLTYLNAQDHRAEIALRSTLYRFAAYLGWREALERQLTYMEYQSNERTGRVVWLLNDVGTQLSTSGLDVVAGRPRLMLWKDEQRAIGGLMLNPRDAPGVLGFETFVDQFDEKFARWLSPFAADFQSPNAEQSERLEAISRSLGELIKELDEEKLFSGRP